jgi:hypothetical protein
MKKMRKVSTNGDLELYEFTPSLFQLTEKYHLKAGKFTDKLLLFLKLFTGYKIYYIYKNGFPVYYCFVSKPYFKHPYLKRKEVLLGYYYTKEEERRKGIACWALSQILSDVIYTRAIVFTRKNNIASQKTILKNGFEQIGYGDYHGKFKIFQISDSEKNNSHLVFAKSKQ